MKVLLVNPQHSIRKPYGSYAKLGSCHPPYGLLCIAGVLEQNNFSVKIIDAGRNPDISLDQIVEQAENFEPDIVGISVYSVGRDQAIETACLLKEALAVPIVVGGPHVIIFPEDLMQFDFIDIAVTGEGEITFLELVKALSSKQGYELIQGINYKSNGQLFSNGKREFIENLDTLPYPAFHLLDQITEYSPMPLIYRRAPVFMLTTSRGCPYSCIYCHALWSKKVRTNSAEYIVGLIDYLVRKFGIKEIIFYEDTFCYDKERVLNICKGIKEKKTKISWSCWSHVNDLSKDILKAMKRAGCWNISLGIESGNQTVLDIIKKSTKIEKIIQVVGWIADAGIKPSAFFMLGLPIDTKQTIRQTINFAKSLPLYTANFTILHICPGSKFSEIAHEYGNVDYDFSLGSGFPEQNLSFVSKGFTPEYLKTMQRRAYIEFFLRPVQIWRLVVMIRSFDDIKKYFKMFCFFLRFIFKKIK
ncbi:MAG: B12-binding domain-containing radical SAM protein [Candidatus Omnitrophica bacterium]|nr:B12-binding domain-containing radical SAM protein [Candidatus Omnitrophota bacterium]